ncbi:unnamed protein product [Saccharomyces cerevisiae]|nr:unnamed protein product [Saccharomyces cerevisiae]
MPPPTAQFMGPTQAGQNESQNQSSGEAGEQNQEHGQGPTPILNQSQPASSQPQHQQQRNESISYYTNFNQPRYSTDASINSFLNISDNVPVTSTGGPSSGGAYSNLPRLSTSSTHQPPDLSQIGRGFSIVNNLFPQQQQLQNQHRQQQQQQQQQSHQQPPFKTPSFSTGLTGITATAVPA